jgi:hypothetical protein
MNSHKNARLTFEGRKLLIERIALMGTMAGLCITGVTLFHAVGRSSTASTVADDMLAGCGLLFLLCTYVTFFALRTRKPGLAVTLEKAEGVLFSIALTAMVATGFVMPYTVW